MAKKRKAKAKSAAPRKQRRAVKRRQPGRGNDMKAVEAALDVAGIPRTDALGQPIEGNAGRVILAMNRLNAADPALQFDPQHPERVVEQMREQDKMRDQALHPPKAKRPKGRKARGKK